MLALIGLTAGRELGWVWMDSMMGIVGMLVIANWSWNLVRASGAVLLDMRPDEGIANEITHRLEAGRDDHRRRSEHDQLAQGFIALPADAALPVSAAGGVVFWVRSSHAAKCRPERKLLGSVTLRTKLSAPIGPIPGWLARHWLTGFSRCDAIRRVSISLSLTSSASS